MNIVSDQQSADAKCVFNFAEGAIQGGNIFFGGTHIFYMGDKPKNMVTSERFAECVKQLRTNNKNADNLLSSEKTAWYAIARIGIDKGVLSPTLSLACDQLHEMGFTEVCYESVRKIMTNYPELSKPYKDWNAQKCSAYMAAYAKQEAIAHALCDLLQ